MLSSYVTVFKHRIQLLNAEASKKMYTKHIFLRDKNGFSTLNIQMKIHILNMRSLT